jgi:hypothetical protein
MKKHHPIHTDSSVPPCQSENIARLLVLINHLEWLRNNVSWIKFQRSVRADAAIPVVS